MRTRLDRSLGYNIIKFSSRTAKAHSRLHNVNLLHIAQGEPAQIRGIISKMKMDIQKKWTSIYDKICVNWSFCAYMRMYREHTVVIPLRQIGSRHPLRCYSRITFK